MNTLLRDRADALTKMGAKTLLQNLRHDLQAAQKKRDLSKTGFALLHMAMVLRGQRKLVAIGKMLEEAQQCFSAEPNQYGLACVIYELSLVQRELGRNTLALEYGQKAVEQFQRLKSTVELGWAYNNLSIIYLNRCERYESLAAAKKARAIFTEFNSPHGLAWNDCHLATLHMQMGFIDIAVQHFTDALEGFQKVNSKQGKAWAMFGLGMARRLECRWEEADALLEKAQRIFEDLDLKERAGWCVLNRAAIARGLGKTEEALYMNNQAIQALSPFRNHDGVAWCLFQIGQLQRDAGQLAKAWSSFKESLQLHTDVSNRHGMGWDENESGKTLIEMGNLTQANECLVKARVMAEQLDVAPLKAEVEKNFALLLLEQAELQRAIDCLDKAEALAQQIKANDLLAEVFLIRARVWIVLGDITRAREAIRSAQSLVDIYTLERLRPFASLVTGELAAMENDLVAANAAFTDAAQRAKKTRQRGLRAAALMNMVQLQRGQQTPAQVGLSIYHVEKDVRAVSSRKLKAKLNAVKGVIAATQTGGFQAKFFERSLHGLAQGNFFLDQRHILEAAIYILEQKPNMNSLLREFIAARVELLKRAPADVHLVRSRTEWAKALPISMII